MKKLKSRIIIFFMLFVIWILITGTESQELILGLFSAVLITFVFSQKADIFEDIKLNPRSVYYALIYIFIFFYELIKSNIDVAGRVIKPELPINPGIVKVKTKLKSKLGRIILANSITLTPGTLTVETRDNDFYIHWIDVSGENIEEVTDQIVNKFEKYLEEIFD